jgi:hypothetical protein
MTVTRHTVRALLAVASAGAILPAHSAVLLSELLINPTGTDNGFEFVELSGVAGTSLTGLTLLSIEGDAAGAGTVDQAISLSGESIGSNGIFLWRDAATVLDWPGRNTTGANLRVTDFSPDLENGSNTFALVSGWTGSVGQDLDTNNDGVLDLTPWTSLLDSIGVRENDTGTNVAYGATAFPVLGFTPDALIRTNVAGGWLGVDVLGTGTLADPFVVEIAENVNLAGNPVLTGGTFYLTPGEGNPTVVPVPAALPLLGGALLALGGLRRRRPST